MRQKKGYGYMDKGCLVRTDDTRRSRASLSYVFSCILVAHFTHCLSLYPLFFWAADKKLTNRASSMFSSEIRVEHQGQVRIQYNSPQHDIIFLFPPRTQWVVLFVHRILKILCHREVQTPEGRNWKWLWRACVHWQTLFVITSCCWHRLSPDVTAGCWQTGSRTPISYKSPHPF